MDPFAKFLKNLSDELLSDDVKNITYLYRKKIPVGYAEKNIKDALSLFQAMEYYELISKTNIEELYTAFDELPRRDLFGYLNNYKKVNNYNNCNSSNALPTENYVETLRNDVDNININDSGGSTLNNSSLNGYCSDDNDDPTSNNPINENADADANGDQVAVAVAVAVPKEESRSPDNTDTQFVNLSIKKKPEEYVMKKEIHGYCIIFNNYFKGIKKFSEREGTDVDAKSLKTTFRWLGFVVEELVDKSDVEIVDYLKWIVSQEEQLEYECFVCCILSHGFQGGIYGNDGSILTYEDLIKIFVDERNDLFGKPKLFVIQACRGDVDAKGYPLQTDSRPVDRLNKKTLPSDADIIFFVPNTSGKTSFRHPTEGTWFIQTLCQELQENGHTWSLDSIMKEVKNKVSLKYDHLGEGVTAKMMPEVMKDTSRKQLRFHPKCPFSEFISRMQDE